MGHKKKDGRNSRTLHQQAHDRLQKMQAFGDSKRLDKLENPEEFARKIYSFSTYQTYFKHIKYFIKWIQKEHPEVKTLKKAEKFVPEWLQTRVDKGLSRNRLILSCIAATRAAKRAYLPSSDRKKIRSCSA